MDDTTRNELLLSLAVQVRALLSLVSDRDRQFLKPGQAQRLADADSAAKTLASNGVPAHAAACRRLERALCDGIEVLRWLTSEGTVAYRLTDAWALLRDDMTRCRINTKAGVDQGTSPDDEPVN